MHTHIYIHILLLRLQQAIDTTEVTRVARLLIHFQHTSDYQLHHSIHVEQQDTWLVKSTPLQLKAPRTPHWGKKKKIKK